jgi:YesN/AraC family two-component response regulator
MKTLMIVEDEAVVREALCTFFNRKKRDEIKVFPAANGKEAIDTYRDSQPDCVFLDLGLPDIHGFDVLKSIKTMNAQARVYIVSGYTDPETKAKAKELGAQSFISKPVNISELLNLV